MEKVAESNVGLADVLPASAPPSTHSIACLIFGGRFYSYGTKPEHGICCVSQKPLTARSALARIKSDYEITLRASIVKRAPTSDDDEDILFTSWLDHSDSDLSREWGHHTPTALTPKLMAGLWDQRVDLPVETMGFWEGARSLSSRRACPMRPSRLPVHGIGRKGAHARTTWGSSSPGRTGRWPASSVAASAWNAPRACAAL
jgi:hypothetical protein